jgi:hypothetical protein
MASRLLPFIVNNDGTANALTISMSKQTKHSIRGDSGDQISINGNINESLITSNAIEQRAAEIALLQGRNKNQLSESDRILAKRELLGDDAANNPTDESEIVAGGMGYPPTSTGHQTPKYLPADDEVEIRTVQQGVDEAEHRTMIEACKSQI